MQRLSETILREQAIRSLPRDTRERYASVASLVRRATNILDVGGVAGELQLFVPQLQVLTVNLEPPADVIFDGSVLPFEDDSFDVVTSLDVIEHMRRSNRPAHLAELMRVARFQVILTCPLGTKEHIEGERRLAKWYADVTGNEHRFLEEHLKWGLPTEEELRALAAANETLSDATFELGFSGDFRMTNTTFVRSVLARRNKRPIALLKYGLHHFAPLRLRPLGRQSNQFTNRAFLSARLDLRPPSA